MATHNTITVTLDNGSSMTSAEASQIQVEIADMVQKRFRGDARVTTITNTFASTVVTIAIV